MTTETIRSLADRQVELPSETLEAFRKGLRGELLEAEDADYETVRQLYNAMIEKRPALIARCVDAADVMTAVDFARDNEILMAVRGGGHNGPGLGSCEGGLMVDLSPMNGVRVDPNRRTARVEGGSVWGDVDHATHAFGLATPSGILPPTGVGGLTLGGGHGYLTREYGLTIDNLLEADIVLANGQMVTASPSEHADLFWALRGGGGNFGVVTSFLFDLHPVDEVYAGPIFWDLDDARAVMQTYGDFMPQAPEQLYGFFGFTAVPPADPFPEELHGSTVCGVVWCCDCPANIAEEAMEPFRHETPTPLWEHLGPMPYPALQSFHDQFYPPGYDWYWKGDFVRELTNEAIDLHVEFGSQLPTPLSTMHLYPVDGAVHDVGQRETAFSYREANWSQVIVGVADDPQRDDEIIDWARDYYEAIHPHTLGGAYVNFMMEEGGERIRATYRENYDRLLKVKQSYDPQNLFRVNQNIAPE